MKLAIVVQRYGADINGGAELHARYVATLLARQHEVTVLTTCARDYVTWRNEIPAGPEEIDGVSVERFPVRHERDPQDFGKRSQLVFEARHSVADELAWLESEGPASPALVRHLAECRTGFDVFIFFSYRYYHAYHGIHAVGPRAILVPTAERDPALGVSLFAPVFRGVRAIMFNSLEERALIRAVAGTRDLPGEVVGIGSRIPARTHPERFRRTYGIDGPYVIYVGRIDENKGCAELFRFFDAYARGPGRFLKLLLIGTAVLPIPDSPQIQFLGYVPDEDKFDAIAGAEALMMPSYFESLSMVALEAWAVGRPVLANGRCDVLRGQCARSNAGLYYESYEEFAEALHLLVTDRHVNRRLGQNGREFYQRHYAWPVIETKYARTLERLQREDGAGVAPPRLERPPGWLARRRRRLRPAREVVDGLPVGPVLPSARSRPDRRPAKPVRRTGRRRVASRAT